MSAEYPFTGTVPGMLTNDTETELPLFQEWAWDFTHNCFLYDGGGRRLTVTENEAIKVWIYKALRTERFRYLAYSWQYGLELEPFIGKVMSVQQRYSELKHVIIECLMVNPYIRSIDSIAIDANKRERKVDVSVILTTVYGEVNINV